MTTARSGRAVVIGSINVDHVASVEHLCLPGETVVATSYAVHPGGKGANQAIAIARADASVAIVGRIGEDQDGRFALETLRANGVDTSAVRAIGGSPTGRAFIQVAASGENAICVVQGANAQLLPDSIPTDLLTVGDVVVLQGETPPETIVAVTAAATDVGAQVVMNLAPWVPLPAAVLAQTSVLVVNEVEAAAQLRTTPRAVLDDPVGAVNALAAASSAAIITLGANGAAWSSGGLASRIPGHAVDAVDTTGAGDAFVGNLAASLLAGHPLDSAVRIANAAGALTATRHGATPSLPSAAATMRFLADHGSAIPTRPA